MIIQERGCIVIDIIDRQTFPLLISYAVSLGRWDARDLSVTEGGRTRDLLIWVSVDVLVAGSRCSASLS